MLLLAQNPGVGTVDITGGAPELNPSFRYLVRESRRLGRRVISRCNLTILFEPGQEDLADFLAEQGTELIASLPCYTAETVDGQRGRGVFERSIEGLRRLNAVGYGQPDSGLILNLIYNPSGAFLPPSEAKLQVDYERELGQGFGIRFDRLLTLTNMPVKRFLEWLQREGKYSQYIDLLVANFNSATVERTMCRTQINIGWDGRLYDCDFNQTLEIPAPLAQHPMAIDVDGAARTVWDVENLEDLVGAPIATGIKCFGCTAGAGSSCCGALD
jgi:radical SAM/Cys-rich protein